MECIVMASCIHILLIPESLLNINVAALVLRFCSGGRGADRGQGARLENSNSTYAWDSIPRVAAA